MATTAPAPTPAGVAEEVSPRARQVTLFLLTATYFFSYMDRQILAILLEDIKADLLLSDTQLGLLSGLAFAIFYATLGIPVAALADRVNRVNIISVALGVWSGITALCGLAQNFTHLLLARIGVGIGEGRNGGDAQTDAAFGEAIERAETRTLAGGITLGVGSALLAGGIIRWIVVERRQRAVDLAVHPRGLAVSGRLPSLADLRR